jgi:hypothetical protein
MALLSNNVLLIISQLQDTSTCLKSFADLILVFTTLEEVEMWLHRFANTCELALNWYFKVVMNGIGIVLVKEKVTP